MGRWRILAYHWVDPADARLLERQLQAFQRRGGRFRPFSQSLQDRATSISVSFDDGDQTVCSVAQPVLDALGIRAILYVAPQFMRRGQTEAGRPAATWEQLGRWLAAGHEIGSHTQHHVPLPSLPPARWEEELEQSRVAIRRELGIAAVHFAYPWGKHDARTDQWFRAQSIWASAVTIERGGNGRRRDPYTLRRDVLEPAWTEAQVRWRLYSGWCAPLYRLYRRLRPLPVPDARPDLPQY